MKYSILRIALGGLVAAGTMVYGQQQPQDNPKQPPQQQSQPPGQAPKQSMTAEQVFATLDTNHDGKLSEEEFSKLFRDANAADVQQEFSRWDKNGDHVITIEEFKASYPQQ
ncbi:MAG: EF-hand domain pair [Bryobacterales bacterium]|nr:EF-hand domain pair [Bryobacterales bacterium]